MRVFDLDGTLRREEYVYTYEKNAEDDGGVAQRDFRIAVSMRTRTNQLSPKAATLTVNNPAPSAPSNFFAANILRNVYVKADSSTDLDFTGMIVHVATTPAFTPTAGNEVHRGAETSVTIDASLAYGTTYYIKASYYDGFGETGLNYSTELQVTPTELEL